MRFVIRIVIDGTLDDIMTNEGKGYTFEEALKIILELPPVFDYVGMEAYDIKGGIYFE